jgi:hypothetical protein
MNRHARRRAAKREPRSFREELIQTVMRQLPGVPEPRIMVQLLAGRRTPEQEAELAAEEYQEPVAIASMDGRLLAYRIPRGQL